MILNLSLSFATPLVILAGAVFAFVHSGRRPGLVTRMSEFSALAAITLAFAGVWQYLLSGAGQASIGSGILQAAMRADAFSTTVTLLVAFIGWVVMRYSRTYLDGEAREGAFHGMMLATLAAVLVFVQSGSFVVLLASTFAVGLGLRKLLLFYPERQEAQRAASKFAYVWHGGDIALIAAAVLLFIAFGTAEFSSLADEASAGMTVTAHIGVAFIVLGAALKTATFPLHGWLTEVMEAPTPVSALLHAGIINSGGVLLIMASGLVQHSSGAMAALVMLGGFTALFGAAVMLTQSAVKTALAWSTVSQMGFMLLQCGLGLWALALLHIVAHSLYKAHAFLSSGGAVQAVAELRRPGPVAVPKIGAVVKSFAVAIALYGVIAVAFSLVLGPKTAQALALGGILIFGVAYLVAQGLADMAPAALTKRTALASLGAALAYFAFQAAAEALWGPTLPMAPVPGPLEWALIVLAVASFGLVAFAQALFPLWAHHPAMAGLRVHLANGLYLNALLDRAIGGFRMAKPN